MNTEHITLLFLSCGISALIGAAGYWLFQKIKISNFKSIAASIIYKAEQESEAIKKASELTFKQNQLDHQRELEQVFQQERKKIQKEEERFKQREDKLESRMNLVEKKLSDIEKREAILIARKTQLDDEKKQVTDCHAKLLADLERASGLSTNEAKEFLLAKLTNEVKTDAANLIRRITKEAEEEADRRANKILANAINRLAVSSVSEVTVNTVTIPSDEMKGRIIGREGRNIRALERATGISFIIDDTPGAVVLTGFDPIRMHVAKLTLEDLIQDGRIHPTRIEEAVEKAKINVQKLVKKYGEDAGLRIGAMNLHPELITLLGKLKFRYSYGQNILDHSLEVAHLMGMMASEMELDCHLAKRIGLLHDVGKAVSHEVEGSHAIIGHDLALKYGESKEVANGIGCHHFEIEAQTIEGSLCSSADAISASRQGARSEPVEEYVKRLKKLEDLAFTFPGVEKAYAMQAGREVRVVVMPDMVDDAGVINLARDLTKRIEKDLSYPGKIRVTVIREKRITEYAL